MSDWNPEAYARFRGFRLRPALDLLAQVPELTPGDVVDLGCGAGAVGPVLRQRFADRKIIGIDLSAAMLAEARGTGAYDALRKADIAHWRPEVPPALIFSNAALHWVPDHADLMTCLAGLLPPGGVLAVQMPRQHDAPSHVLIRAVAAALFPDRFDLAQWTAPVTQPGAYARLLAPYGTVSVWETEYLQSLPSEAGSAAHPVRRFTEATAMRPFVEKLSTAEVAAFVAGYEAELRGAYSAEPDGTVLFAFRRVFFVLTR